MIRVIIFLVLFSTQSFAGELEDKQFIEELALKFTLIRLANPAPMKSTTGQIDFDIPTPSETLIALSFEDAKTFLKIKKQLYETPKK